METINICLKVLTNNKKAVKESFQLKQVPKFSSASELKNFIVIEKLRAANVDSLEIGFHGPPFTFCCQPFSRKNSKETRNAKMFIIIHQLNK